jgi:hypothetical protein
MDDPAYSLSQRVNFPADAAAVAAIDGRHQQRGKARGCAAASSRKAAPQPPAPPRTLLGGARRRAAPSRLLLCGWRGRTRRAGLISGVVPRFATALTRSGGCAGV